MWIIKQTPRKKLSGVVFHHKPYNFRTTSHFQFQMLCLEAVSGYKSAMILLWQTHVYVCTSEVPLFDVKASSCCFIHSGQHI